jgi:hypothetical protein
MAPLLLFSFNLLPFFYLLRGDGIDTEPASIVGQYQYSVPVYKSVDFNEWYFDETLHRQRWHLKRWS